MSKRNKALKSSINPVKRNLSKSKHQQNISRIALIATAIFLVVIVGIILFGLYNNEIKPLNQPTIEVNNTIFDMDYYIEMLNAYTKNLQAESVEYMADSVINQIVRNELIKQGATALAVMVSNEEVEAALSKTDNADEDIYMEIAESELINNKVLDYFNDKLPYEIEQIHINIMLVEDELVANTVVSRINSGEDFGLLSTEFSIESEGSKNKIWLPEELIDNPLLSEKVSISKAGDIDKVFDGTLKKESGYWIIEVTDIDEIKGRNVRVILLGSHEQAEEVKEKLNVEDFNDLAMQYSQHDSKENGGELGWLQMGEIGNEAFDDIVFDIPLGEISGPFLDNSIETTGGYWVIELLAREIHELATETSKVLAQKNFIDWLLEQEDNSTVIIHLDSVSESWAVKKVLRGRK